MSRATGYIKDRPELLGRGKRLIRCFMYAHLVENDNPYAHPLDFTASNFLLHFKSKKKNYIFGIAQLLMSSVGKLWTLKISQ
jgi:hypothetical protein